MRALPGVTLERAPSAPAYRDTVKRAIQQRAPVDVERLRAALEALRAARGAGEEVRRVIVQFEGEPLAAVRAGPGGVAAARAEALQRMERAYQSFAEAVKRQRLSVAVSARFRTVFNGVAVEVRAKDVPRLLALPGVKAVYPVRTYRPLLDRSVPHIGAGRNLPPGYQHVTGAGVVVGVLDTGIDASHPAFQGAFAADGVGHDYVDDDDDPSENADPPSYHGTHVAGIIAGRPVTFEPSGKTYAGVAPGATLKVYRVLGPGGGTTDDIIAAVEQAVADGAKVLNLSLGAELNDPDEPLAIALDNAFRAGVLPVVANGNSGPDRWTVGTPATSRLALSVGASTPPEEVPSLRVTGDAREIQATLLDYSPSAAGLVGREHPLVYAGLGRAEDFQGVDAQGKVVLVSRGQITFREKAMNAEAAGAAALVIFNNQPGPFRGTLGDWGVSIPVLAISQEDGQYLLDKLAAAQAASTAVGAGATAPASGTASSGGATGGAGGTGEAGRATPPAQPPLPGAQPVLPGGRGLPQAPSAGGEGAVTGAPGVVGERPQREAVREAVQQALQQVAPPAAQVAPRQQPVTVQFAVQIRADDVAEFSSRGPAAKTFQLKPDVVAPGVGIVSALPGGTFGILSGTSMAAPHVAGAAALVMEAHPRWTAAQVKAALVGTAVDLQGYPREAQGAGRIDVAKALTTPIVAVALDEQGEETGGSLNFGHFRTGTAYEATRKVRVYNVSEAEVEVTVTADAAVPGVRLAAEPSSFTVPAGGSVDVAVTLTADGSAADGLAAGELVFSAAGGAPVGVPYSLFVGQPDRPLVHTVFADPDGFSPNGDGVKDRADIYFTLNDAADWVWAAVWRFEPAAGEWVWFADLYYTESGLEAGTWRLGWDGSKLPDDVYLVTVAAGVGPDTWAFDYTGVILDAHAPELLDHDLPGQGGHLGSSPVPLSGTFRDLMTQWGLTNLVNVVLRHEAAGGATDRHLALSTDPDDPSRLRFGGRLDPSPGDNAYTLSIEDYSGNRTVLSTDLSYSPGGTTLWLTEPWPREVVPGGNPPGSLVIAGRTDAPEVTVSLDGREVARVQVTGSAFRTTVTLTAEQHAVTVRADNGRGPVTVERVVRFAGQYELEVAPQVIGVSNPVDPTTVAVRVTRGGVPAGGVAVRLLGYAATTGPDGRASFTLSQGDLFSILGDPDWSRRYWTPVTAAQGDKVLAQTRLYVVPGGMAPVTITASRAGVAQPLSAAATNAHWAWSIGGGFPELTLLAWPGESPVGAAGTAADGTGFFVHGWLAVRGGEPNRAELRLDDHPRADVTLRSGGGPAAGKRLWLQSLISWLRAPMGFVPADGRVTMTVSAGDLGVVLDSSTQAEQAFDVAYLGIKPRDSAYGAYEVTVDPTARGRITFALQDGDGEPVALEWVGLAYAPTRGDLYRMIDLPVTWRPAGQPPIPPVSVTRGVVHPRYALITGKQWYLAFFPLWPDLYGYDVEPGQTVEALLGGRIAGDIRVLAMQGSSSVPSPQAMDAARRLWSQLAERDPRAAVAVSPQDLARVLAVRERATARQEPPVVRPGDTVEVHWAFKTPHGHDLVLVWDASGRLVRSQIRVRDAVGRVVLEGEGPTAGSLDFTVPTEDPSPEYTVEVTQPLGDYQQSPAVAVAKIRVAGAAAVVRLDPAAVRIAGKDKEFTVDVKVDGVQGLYAYQFTLDYDPAVVRPLDVDVGDALTSVGQVQVVEKRLDQPGKVMFAATLSGTRDSFSGSGTMARIRFKTVAAGTTSLAFSELKLSNVDAQPIAAEPSGGTVEVLATGVVTGTVTLQARSQHGDARIRVLGKGITVQAAADGSYRLELEPGTYDLLYEAPGYLPELRRGVQVTADGTTQVEPVQLLAGDLVPDRLIDIYDVVVVARAFGTRQGEPRYELQSDIDRDGDVDLDDLMWVARNFRQSRRDLPQP